MLGSLLNAVNLGGVDLTPGFSAKNVIKTQAGNVQSKINDPNYDLIPFGPGANANTNGNIAQQTRDNQQRIAADRSQTLGAATTNDPSNPYVQGGSATDRNGNGTPDSDELAYLDDQGSLLQQMLAEIQGSYGQGYKNIDDSYNSSKNKATGQFGRATEDFNVRQADTESGKEKAIGKVDTNARTLSDSLRRMLGMASGSGSSAYQITAPGAVARQASLSRGEVQDTFGANFRDLDTARTRTKDDYESLLEELSGQRNTARRDFETGLGEQANQVSMQQADLARQRAALQGGDYNAIRAASAPFQADIDGRKATIRSLFDKYRTPVQARELKVDTPNLRDYNVDRYGINGNNSQSSTPGGTAPYGNYVRPQAQDEEEQLY